jgi:raffinose/stachyose/melibiose transport system substrate-binding protein
MMNKTIKIIATATAALMMIAGVAACGSDTGGDSDKGRVY